MTKNFKFILALLFVSLSAVSQNYLSTQEIVKSDSKYGVVTLFDATEIKVSIEKGKLKIQTVLESQEVVTNDNVIIDGFNEKSIYYSEQFETLSNVEAYAMNPKSEKSFNRQSADIFEAVSSKSSGVFFDDSKSVKVVFPGLTKGSVRKLKYTLDSENPYMIQGHFFKNYRPVKKSVLRVTFPSSVNMSFKTYGDFENIKFTQSTSRGTTTFEWQAENLPELENEYMAPDYKYLTPKVQLLINDYTINGEKKEVLSDVAHLYKYYNSLVKTVDLGLSEEMKKITDELTKGKSEIEKIRNVYYWVQDNVHYVAFEDGMSGFIPRSPQSVFLKKYGDCKDMASLIYAMLNHAQIKARLGWIGTRSIPYTYEENPTLSVDNHMIAVVKYRDNWIFLDATDSRNDFFVPTEHIIGKECLVGITEDAYEIVKVPINKAAENFQHSDFVINVVEKELAISLKSTYDGYWKNDIKHEIAQIEDSKRLGYVKTMMNVGNNKTEYLNLNIINEKEREKELIFQVDLKVKDFAKVFNKEVFINLNLNPLQIDNIKILPDRKLPLWFNYPFKEINNYTLNIPAGFEISYLPSDISFEKLGFYYKISYKKVANTILAEEILEVKNMHIELKDFSTYNQLKSEIMKSKKELVGLKLKK
jgi:transglutaminase-like putative cysteine protease